jgi:hypothetical protein
MAQPSDTLDSDKIAGSGIGVPQCVERRNTSTQQRSGSNGAHLVWYAAQRLSWYSRILCIPSIKRQPSDSRIFTALKITAPTGITGKAVTAVPANTYPVPLRPVMNICSGGVDLAGNLVARYSGVCGAWIAALFDKGVTVADTTRLYLHSNFIGRRLGNWAFNDIKRFSCCFHLYCLHSV